jgi:hypothetical protein
MYPGGCRSVSPEGVNGRARATLQGGMRQDSAMSTSNITESQQLLTVRGEASGGQSLVTIAASCSSGSCPTVFRTPHGSVVVQGATVVPHDLGVDVPEGEQLVEIPFSLLEAAFKGRYASS